MRPHPDLSAGDPGPGFLERSPVGVWGEPGLSAAPGRQGSVSSGLCRYLRGLVLRPLLEDAGRHMVLVMPSNMLIISPVLGTKLGGADDLGAAGTGSVPPWDHQHHPPGSGQASPAPTSPVGRRFYVRGGGEWGAGSKAEGAIKADPSAQTRRVCTPASLRACVSAPSHMYDHTCTQCTQI